MAIVAGVVADPAGNLWDLPANVNVPSGGQVTVTATADAQNPNAEYPGSSVALTIENPQAGWDSAATPAQVTPVEFITNFPEFGNNAVYPLAQIQFWLNAAYQQVRAQVWQDQTDLGAQLFTAHYLVLAAQAAKAALTGGVPGQNTGAVNNRSVDKVSVGYDTANASVKDAGNWNLTTYGTRFKYFVNMFGAGGIQIGACGFGYPYPGFP